MARIIIESGVDKGVIYPITKPVTSIGRSTISDVQILDKKVSRYHAEILKEDETFKIRDLNSKNGTYLNKESLKGTLPLNNGDVARVGDTALVFEIETQKSGSVTDVSSIAIEDIDWGETKGVQSAGIESPKRLPIEAGGGESLRDTHLRLETLYHVTDIIRSILNLDDLLNQIMNIVFTTLQPDEGCIFLTKEGSPEHELIPRLLKRIDEDADIPFTVSKSIIDRCLREKVSILVSDAAHDTRFDRSESIVAERITSAICAPLIYKDEIFGVIYIDARNRLRSYQQEDLEIFTSITNQSAMGIANARLHKKLIEQERVENEMEIARTIQMNLLPSEEPRISGFEVAALSRPAKRVGGDFYDFIEISHDNMAIGMADVSGKGVPAAILAASLRTALQITAPQFPDSPVELISFLNELVFKDTSEEMYITLFYCLLNTNLKSITYVNAGHRPPMLVYPNGQVIRLSQGGTFLGLQSQTPYEYGTVKIDPGSALVIFSDGLTDSINVREEVYGEARINKTVLPCLSSSAYEILDTIVDDVETFRSGAVQFDDLTIVILKAKG